MIRTFRWGKWVVMEAFFWQRQITDLSEFIRGTHFLFRAFLSNGRPRGGSFFDPSFFMSLNEPISIARAVIFCDSLEEADAGG